MRPHVVLFACLAVPCLLLAQIVSCAPVYDGNNQIQPFDTDDWTGGDALGDQDFMMETEKRDRPNRREVTYCMDWIHNTWRPCRGRKAG
ncbi:uncharacterized protein LOC117300111 [Asterias rubens]|uniref:Melanin-concentrating hormone-type n=1 Tax=Asterias rubens TaxID=7604 RepID=A0A0U2PL91_ASTRU|nr:uncharacterized protein LOC117300111 [Asterias rubens]ALJ99948.1 melanin-concentrating hormone-type precursor [Asterias rubens]